jgi:hydrogenase maturation protein HypF
MACAWLTAAGGVPPAHLAEAVPADAWRAVARMAATGFAAPETTSIGRLFDAVAALAGLRLRADYEGQAAMELEAAAAEDDQPARAYPVPLVVAPSGALVLDARETVLQIADDAAAGRSPATISARFHAALADATAAALVRIAAYERTDVVVLSGGVFQNRRLLDGVTARLAGTGLRVLVPERLPPNDGAIAYGQAAVAAAIAARAG